MTDAAVLTFWKHPAVGSDSKASRFAGDAGVHQSLHRGDLESQDRPAGIGRDGIFEHRLRHVLAHELAHLVRGDLWTNWLLLPARTLHWFNPVAWWTVREMQAEREAACDELAFAALGETDRSAYAATITGTEASALPSREFACPPWTARARDSGKGRVAGCKSSRQQYLPFVFPRHNRGVSSLSIA